jgi:hypothetical protein
MGIDKREYLRYQSSVIARVRIIIPEQTFTPFTHDAIILDMSELGMKLRTYDIDISTFKLLMSSTRMVRITFTPPSTEKAHTLFGKIVWLDFNNLTSPPTIQYGVALEPTDEKDKNVIRTCTKFLESKKTER